jgi:isoquinoline 1-oxidoreductase beta subunit
MVTPEGVQLWLGTQGQTFDQMVAARVAGVRPDQVSVETCMLGGGFGRRASVAGDNVAPAVEIAKRLPGVPVQLVWTREDDLTDGFYRPQAHHRVVVQLGADGLPLSWQHTVVAQPLAKGTLLERAMMNPQTGIEVTLTEGIDNLPYAVPVVHVQVHQTTAKVPVQWWRSVGSTHTAFALECCIDECAHAAKQDPVAYRLALLKDSPKERRVLEMVAAKAGWGTPLPKSHARGVAVVSSFGSTVAQVAEISLVNGQPRVHRVVAVMDCGTVVNPRLVEQQMQSAIAYGLSAALREEITFAADQVEQTNFHAYQPLRLDEMPVVEVHLMESTEPPTGVGEPGTPPIGPAVANALRALTGEAVRQLPFSRRSWG